MRPPARPRRAPRRALHQGLGLVLLGGLLLGARAQDGAPSDAPGPAPDEPTLEERLEDLPAYPGRFETGYREALERRAAGDWAGALGLALALSRPDDAARLEEALGRNLWGHGARLVSAARPVTRALGFTPRDGRERATALYLGARILHDQGDGAGAELLYARALGAGGSLRAGQYGELGLAQLDLEHAEALYAEIPEVQGRSQNAMSPGFLDDPSVAEEPEDDPLPKARAAYLDAREHLVRALRIDPMAAEPLDEGTRANLRANVELVQRRLRRLDEIEEERRQDEGQERSEEGEQDQQQPPEQSQDSQDQGTPSESDQPPPEDAPQESEAPEDEDRDSDSTEDASPEDTEETQESSESEGEPEPSERELTAEERKRMMEELRRHNEAGRERREMLIERRRAAVEKDW